MNKVKLHTACSSGPCSGPASVQLHWRSRGETPGSRPRRNPRPHEPQVKGGALLTTCCSNLTATRALERRALSPDCDGRERTRLERAHSLPRGLRFPTERPVLCCAVVVARRWALSSSAVFGPLARGCPPPLGTFRRCSGSTLLGPGSL